jgi:hypothetical protein
MRCDKVGPTSTGNCGLVATKEPTLDITKETIPVCPPLSYNNRIPIAGPLSILNAYCMIRLHKQASYEYAGEPGRTTIEGMWNTFGDMVEKIAEFCYSVHDVDRMLGEMRCIVNELSTKQRDHI